ncbi:MAG: ATP-dependent helicase, partial [bacterium]
MSEELFRTKYKNLNPAQKKAVDTIEGPVMVIAGPGTGKTTILTLRIANILRLTDTPASGILAITFTDAGVKAMRIKLREVIGARADEVRIYTFHSFASAVIAEFPEHFVHIARAQQMTDIEAQELVRGILKDKKYKMIRPLGEPDHYVSGILTSISNAKREALTPEMVRDFAKSEAERIAADPDSLSTRGATKGQLKADARKQVEKAEKTLLLADVYEAYEEKKRGNGSGSTNDRAVGGATAARKIDFDDLIFELLQAIRTDELLHSLIQEKYLYLLVDEHQDTNDSQNAIIRAIADFFDSPNLFVVGDEKQAVYRFQGASVQNFLQFQNAWKNMQVISLEENYRSHQHILDSSFSLIENNYADGEHPLLRVKLRAGKSGEGADEKPRPIEVVTAGNSAAADMALVALLKEFIAKSAKNAESSSEKTAAIIVRRNRDVERLATLCEANGVYAASERGINIFLHPIGALFFDLIHFLHDPSQTESLAVTLASGLWGVEFARAAELIRLAKSGKGASATLTHGGKGTEVLAALPIVATVREEMTQRGGLAFLVYATEQSGLLPVIAKSPANTEVWRGIVALATELAGRDRAYADDPRRLIEALLSYRATAETRSVKILSG